MNTPPPDGGPAFPGWDVDKDIPINGMSLRDWFAGMALFCIATHSEARIEYNAVVAYKYADAMLKEKGRRDEQ